MRSSILCSTVVLLLAACGSAIGHEITAASDPAAMRHSTTKATATTDDGSRRSPWKSRAAGSVIPAATGKFEGAKVDAYVWPTQLDPAAAGFEKGSGISRSPSLLILISTTRRSSTRTATATRPMTARLAFALGGARRGRGVRGRALVRDVSPGEDIPPATAPGLPLALDSPGMSPLSGQQRQDHLPVAGAADVCSTPSPRSPGPPRRRTPLLCVTGACSASAI